MKKIFSFFLSLLMCFSIITPVNAAQNSKGFIDKVTVENVNGGEIGVDSHLKVKYEWSLKDHKKGDVIKVTLPKELVVPKKLDFVLKTDTNEELGQVHVGLNNVVTITLTDPNNYIKTHENIHGTLEFSSIFNKKDVSAGKHHLEFVENNGAISSTDVNISADPNAPQNNQYISKWGIVYEDQGIIKWRVRVNYAQKELHNAYVLENLGSGQSLLADTIKIYEVNYKAQSDEVISKTDVTNQFKISDIKNSGFKVNFGDINKSYLIEFDSKITNMSQVKYLNSATIKADGIEESDSAKEELFSGNGSATGELLYSLRITKRDGDTLAPLANVTFNLADANKNVIYDDLTTDVDGVVNVGGLSQGTYYLTELKTNDGYELLNEPIKIVIDKNSPKQINVVVDNFKKKLGSVELLKTDECNHPLANVKFNLINLDNYKIIKTNLTTDKNGKIVVTGLKEGNYAFKEVQGLKGYKYSNQLYKFSITKTNINSVIKVHVVNCRLKADVCFNKIDQYGYYVCNAVLGLYDENNNLLFTWKSGQYTTKLKDLIVGKEYTIKELQVPNGYKKAQNITFRVNYDGVLEIKCGNCWIKQNCNIINMIDKACYNPCYDPCYKPCFDYVEICIQEIIVPGIIIGC